MIIKVNRSFHETINIILSVRLGMNESTSPDCPGKYIIFSMCGVGKFQLGGDSSRIGYNVLNKRAESQMQLSVLYHSHFA